MTDLFVIPLHLGLGVIENILVLKGLDSVQT